MYGDPVTRSRPQLSVVNMERARSTLNVAGMFRRSSELIPVEVMPLYRRSASMLEADTGGRLGLTARGRKMLYRSGCVANSGGTGLPDEYHTGVLGAG